MTDEGSLWRRAWKLARKESTTLGPLDRLDWLNRNMVAGSRIVWPCDAYGSMSGPGRGSKQMAVGVLVEFLDNGGATVDVERRSRTGSPKPGYDKTRVRLSAVGLAQATVVP